MDYLLRILAAVAAVFFLIGYAIGFNYDYLIGFVVR